MNNSKYNILANRNRIYPINSTPQIKTVKNLNSMLSLNQNHLNNNSNIHNYIHNNSI